MRNFDNPYASESFIVSVAIPKDCLVYGTGNGSGIDAPGIPNGSFCL